MKDMQQKPFNELTISVNATKSEGGAIGFQCLANAEKGYYDPDVVLYWKGFSFEIPSLSEKAMPKHRAGLLKPLLMLDVDSDTVRQSEDSILFMVNLVNHPVQAIQDYELTRAEFDRLRALSTPDIQPEINQYFGDILKKILEGAGYKVEIVIVEPEYYYAPTMDYPAQRIYTGDKKGSALADLMLVGREDKAISESVMLDERGFEVVGLKIDVDIPSEKAAGGQIQLRFDFDFRQEGGFKIIPIKDLEKPKTQEKLNNLLQEVERKISKDLDPLALRVKDAVICLSQDKGSRKYNYTEDELLNLLYKPSGKYHDTRSKQRVRERLQLISKIKLTYAMKIGDKIIGIEDIPHIILNPEGRPFIEHLTKGGKVKKRYNFQSIEIPERYFNLFYGHFAGQFNRKSLLLTGTDYSLYKAIATWWRNQWEKDRGVYKWNLTDVLRGAGITLPGKTNEARVIKKLTTSLGKMKTAGLLKDYKRLNKHKNAFLDTWQFEAPDELKKRLKHIGKDYQEAQKMKSLKMKKKGAEIKVRHY